MKRKVIKQGAATLMVSLPRKWTKVNKVDKGDEVDIEIVDKILIVSSTSIKLKTETEINFRGETESSIINLITNSYRSGYDKIIAHFENDNQFTLLEDILRNRLIGFDITNKETKKCIIENITEPSEEQFDNILNKVFLNISTLLDITEKRMMGKKPDEDYKKVGERIMKYDNFCRRVISKRKLVMERAEFFWSFLHLLDNGQRELYHLNNHLKNIKISEKTKELLKGCNDMFNLIRESYLSKNLEVLAKTHHLESELIYKKGYKALELSKGKESVVLYHLLASIRKFYQTNSPLSGLII